MQYLGLPQWGDYLLKGILIFIMLSASAVVLSRAGRNPYLAFLVIFPYMQIAAIWLFAYSLWDKARKKV